MLYSGASYLDINTWYKIKWKRTKSGVFTLYIKGGSFGDTYQLIDTTGGSGQNPVQDSTYTTSKYCVVDLDVGDKIILGTISNGIKQL